VTVCNVEVYWESDYDNPIVFDVLAELEDGAAEYEMDELWEEVLAGDDDDSAAGDDDDDTAAADDDDDAAADDDDDDPAGCSCSASPDRPVHGAVLAALSLLVYLWSGRRRR